MYAMRESKAKTVGMEARKEQKTTVDVQTPLSFSALYFCMLPH